MKVRQSEELREYNRLYKELANIYYEISAKTGISESAFWVMYTIVDLGDGCIQKEIAARYFLSRQTISSAVRTLEKKGYITLEHGKGRNMHLILTQAGHEFANKHIIPLVDTENKVFELMNPEECRELLRLSHKYNEIFREQAIKLLAEEGEK